MSEIVELKKTLDGIASAWEAFKAKHEQEVAELKKGGADYITKDELSKVNTALDDLLAQKDAIELKVNRLKLSGTADQGVDVAKQVKAFNDNLRAHAISQGRQAPVDQSPEQMAAYKSAALTLVRRGKVAGEEEKAMSVGSDPDGGFLVPADMSGRIVTRLFDTSPIRQYANVVTISSDRLEGVRDIDEADAGWVGEVASRTSTTTPQVGKWEIVAHELYANPQVTQKLLDDAGFDIETWLANKIADKMGRKEATAFVAGTGVNQPQGFCSYSTAATADGSRAWGTIEHVVSGTNGGFTTSSTLNGSEKLIDLIQAFKTGYLQNARWFTTREVLAAIRKFKDTQNQYIWQPGLQAGQPATVLAYPVVLCQDMPALSANGLSLALADMQQAYTIVDRLGMRTLRDALFNKPYVGFYTIKRTGGAVVQSEAIKFLKFST